MFLTKDWKEKMIWCLTVLMVGLCANSFLWIWKYPVLIPVFFLLLTASNFLPFYTKADLPGKRIRVCYHGVKCLSAFVVTTIFSTIYQLILVFKMFPEQWKLLLGSVVLCVVVESVIFWNGILSVYMTSVQLGIKIRVLGAVFGLVPVVNVVLLFYIIHTVSRECAFETERHMRDLARHKQQLCATKYPILLVHGVFFRDIELLNYWGRIPKALQQNGAQIYYGEHESAASVPDSAVELERRIKSIVAQAGCEKVNIIAHSKGGLDCRYAIAHSDVGQYIASLTTVNTPHRGCLFADYLLDKIPDKTERQVADAYNSAMRKLGDKNPDFLAAVYNLTSSWCEKFDGETPVPEGIYCRSIGSKLNHATSGKFPMNFTYLIAKLFDGPNDGLVGEHSFAFGEEYKFLTIDGKRGISHGDMIDLNRENIPGFDVREFYVEIVSELKARGL